LVSDLRGFTTLSETMPAEQVAAHLNEYFPAMIDAIFAERGMINDFIGDGILAVFGAPLSDAAHAWRAAPPALGIHPPPPPPDHTRSGRAPRGHRDPRRGGLRG